MLSVPEHSRKMYGLISISFFLKKLHLNILTRNWNLWILLENDILWTYCHPKTLNNFHSLRYRPLSSSFKDFLIVALHLVQYKMDGTLRFIQVSFFCSRWVHEYMCQQVQFDNYFSCLSTAFLTKITFQLSFFSYSYEMSNLFALGTHTLFHFFSDIFLLFQVFLHFSGFISSFRKYLYEVVQPCGSPTVRFVVWIRNAIRSSHPKTSCAVMDAGWKKAPGICIAGLTTITLASDEQFTTTIYIVTSKAMPLQFAGLVADAVKLQAYIQTSIKNDIVPKSLRNMQRVIIECWLHLKPQWILCPKYYDCYFVLYYWSTKLASNQFHWCSISNLILKHQHAIGFQIYSSGLQNFLRCDFDFCRYSLTNLYYSKHTDLIHLFLYEYPEENVRLVN